MKRISNRIFTAIFIISQFYWLYWIGAGIKNFFFGMNSGWLMPSLSNPTNVNYYFATIGDSFALMIIFTAFTPFIIIPIYQVIYLITVLVKKIRKKRDNKKV